ncbi:MAG: ribose-phosphate diphosphokinase [Thermoprotei archaeon]|jgi:ribose-phosphate pyrophosphokinase
MKLFDLRSNSPFAQELAKLINVPALPVEKKIFPNQEVYVRLTEEPKGEDVILVGTSYPNPNDRFFELFLAVDAAKRSGASSIKAFIPYMAYGRQDRKQRVGESVSALVIATALAAAGLDELYVADYHNPDLIYDMPIRTHNLMTARLIGEYLRNKHDLHDPVIIVPGAKSLEGKYLTRAKEAAEGAGSSYYTGYLKERNSVTGEVRTQKRKVGVKGKDVIVIDDEISTGGTVINALSMLQEEEPSNIYVGCTHGIFANDSLDKIRSMGVSDIVSTDSIPSPVSEVHLAPLFKNVALDQTAEQRQN